MDEENLYDVYCSKCNKLIGIVDLTLVELSEKDFDDVVCENCHKNATTHEGA